jgi:hypothetical protein
MGWLQQVDETGILNATENDKYQNLADLIEPVHK